MSPEWWDLTVHSICTPWSTLATFAEGIEDAALLAPATYRRLGGHCQDIARPRKTNSFLFDYTSDRQNDNHQKFDDWYSTWLCLKIFCYRACISISSCAWCPHWAWTGTAWPAWSPWKATGEPSNGSFQTPASNGLWTHFLPWINQPTGTVG